MLVWYINSVQEVRIEELEAQLESGKADLKSAQKRIDTLHSALKGHEEDFSGDDTREFDDTYGDVTGDDLSSSGSSYKIGEYDDDLDDEDLSGLSDEEGSGIQLNVPSTGARAQTWERSTRSRSRELPPLIDDGELSSSYNSQHRNHSRNRDKRKGSIEEDTAASSQRRDVDVNDDVSSSRRRKHKDLEDEEMPTKTRRKSATENSASKKSEGYKLNVGDDLSSSSRGRSGSKNSLDDRESSKTSSKAKDLDDDDSDADLEELLKKQRERVKSIRDDEEEYRAIGSVRRPSTGSGARPSDEDSSKRVGKTDVSPLTSPSHETKVNGTSKRGNDSREASQEPSEEQSTPSKQKKNRRRQQRQRTIELLTSPRHQVIKSNGVK